MLYREIIAVCSQIHTNHTNTLSPKHIILHIKLSPGIRQQKLDINL